MSSKYNMRFFPAYTVPPQILQHQFQKVDDFEWIDMISGTKAPKSNILLNAYYQRAEVLYANRDLVKGFMDENDIFNGQDIFASIFKDVQVDPEVVVVHLRLDDFNFQNGSNVVDPQFFIEEIKATKKDKVVFIVDKMQRQNELRYIKKIIDNCAGIKVKLQQGSLLEDWNTLRCAPHVISSNSSYAWTACFFGKICNPSKQVVYPETSFYGHQNFSLVDENNNEVDGWKNVKVKTVDYMKF